MVEILELDRVLFLSSYFLLPSLALSHVKNDRPLTFGHRLLRFLPDSRVIGLKEAHTRK